MAIRRAGIVEPVARRNELPVVAVWLEGELHDAVVHATHVGIGMDAADPILWKPEARSPRSRDELDDAERHIHRTVGAHRLQPLIMMAIPTRHEFRPMLV